MANNKYKLIRTNERCVRMTNLKNQSWKPEVFLTNERTEVKGLRKEILLTNNNRTNRRFKSEKEGNVTGYQEASHTQWGNTFEGGKIQPSNELKNPGGIQNVIKSENLLIKVEADDELSLRDECTVEIEDFKRENDVSCTTQLTEHVTNKESVESSTKKYPSLSVTVSESVDRKVVVQPFHLDSNVIDPFAGFTTIENIDDDNKYKLENKCYTSDLIRGKPNICDPLLKQMILTPKKKTEKSDEKSDDEFELEYDKLFELISKVENDVVVKKEIKYSGFQSDAESDDELEEKHRNRRLQVERPSLSSVKSENRECRKPREKKLDFHQINQRRKRCKSSYDHCKDKRFDEADESCSPPQVKRLKWPSGIIKKTETDAIKTKQENLSMGKQANKSAEFWSEVLTTPKLWKTEFNEIDIGICHKETFEMNYHELLNTYISINSVRSKLDNVCWETTFLEKFKDPNSMHYILEYYIPPAQGK